MTQYKFDDIAFNSKAKKKPVEQDKETYIGLEHLDSKCLYVNRFGSEVAPIGEKLLMKKGDVLFGKRRAYQKKVAIAPFDGIFSAHGMVLRPKEDVIDKDFFPFFISSDYFLDSAIKISVGSLSPTINWGDLKELKFDLPSLAGQKKLAKVLWAAEKTRQGYKSLLTKTDELIKSKFIEMFGDPNFSKKHPKIALYKIGEILTGATPSTKKSEYYSSKDIPFIKPSDFISDAVQKISNPEFFISKKALEAARLFPKNSILTTCIGIIGKIGISTEESACNQQINVIIPNKNINYLYLAYCLFFMQSFLSDLANAPVVPILNKSEFSAIAILNPHLTLQNKFADFVKQAEQSKSEIQQSLDDLNAMTSALINKNLK